MSEQQPIPDYQPLSEPNRFLAIVSVLASLRDCLAWLWLHARGQNLNGYLPVMEKGKPEWWEAAIEFLKEDELLGKVVRKYPNGSLEGKGELFETTIRSIVGQQISVVASDAIWGRLLTMIGKPIPENVLKFTEVELASCGLTRPKASYIYGLAKDSDSLLNQDWDNMNDNEIKQHLIQFRGIGPWTAEMMLMFSFMRPDVFSIGDIGLVKAVKILVPEVEDKNSIEQIAERWSPYRTAASWYLWRMIDPVPVGY